MQFSEDQMLLTIHSVIEMVWKTTCQSVVLLGEGVYGRSYGVTFASSPYRAVVKVYKYSDIGRQERRQLIELHSHLREMVPRVYAYLPEIGPGEALVMEWLPGKSYRQPELLPLTQRALLQRQAVDLLLNIHSIQHREGYGAFDGPFYRRWWDYYGQRVMRTHQAITSSEEARSYFGPQILALMDRALQHSERILDTSMGQPVLLHGDFCFGNLLFDSHTWHISGLIDPLDAEWGERELDLVNVVNGHVKHFELLNRYREAIDLGPSFPIRYWFYHVWTWLAYYVQVRTHCREWVLRCGRELDKAIERYL